MADDKSTEGQLPGVRQLDAGALRALAHPLRVRIYDILTQRGEQTASSLAALTGESSGSTSYHLRALAEHGLIEDVPHQRGRQRWWRRVFGPVSFASPEALETPSGRAASQLVLTESLNRRHQQLLAFMDELLSTEADDWHRQSLNSTASVHLTLEQMVELNESLRTVVDEVVSKYRGQTGPHVRPVTIRTDVFPIPPERP